MVESYLKFWGNYVNFEGKSTRSDYWYLVLSNFLLGMLAVGVTFFLGFLSGWGEGSIIPIFIWGAIIILYTIASIVPSVALSVRRLRDGGFHWALIFISFIPYVGSLALFVLYCMPSKEGAAY